jgi:hypothetical protein
LTPKKKVMLLLFFEKLCIGNEIMMIHVSGQFTSDRAISSMKKITANLRVFGIPIADRAWDTGGCAPHLVVSSTPLEKSSPTLKNLLDHTCSAFRIAISGTSTVSACRFLATI